MSHYFTALRKAFEEKANQENARKQKAYMRNQFEFFGLGADALKALTKDFLQQHGFPPAIQMRETITELWQQPERECQYFAMMMLEKKIKTADESIIDLLEWMIINKSWWDTIDMIAPKLAGTYFKNYPHQINNIIEKWMHSGNFWLQRACLLFQLKYKSATNQELLFDLINRLSGENEFFIRKAIGWALREYSKTNPEAVLQFVATHDLKPLSRKEALKRIQSSG
jgi:3-methyladenine DNA glycosylase AlkD